MTLQESEIQHLEHQGVYLRLLALTRHNWLLYMLSFFGFLLYGLSNAAFAHLMKLLIDSLQQGIRKEVYFAGLIIVLFAFRGLGGFLGTYSMASISKELVHDLRIKLYDAFMSMPAWRYDQMESSALIARMTYGAGNVASSVTSSLKTVLQEGLYVAGLLAYIFWLNWRLASVFIVVTPVIAWLVSVTGKRFRKIAKQMINSQSKIIQTASETIKGYREIRAYGVQGQFRQKFRRESEQYRKQTRKLDLTKSINSPLVQMLVAFALAFLVWLALNPDTGGSMSPGDFIAFLLAVSMLIKPLKELTEVNATLQKGIGSAQVLFQYLDLDPEQDQGQDDKPLASTRISFENVSFHYGDPGKPVFRDISFALESGQMVALVGRSGEGKSTLAKLMLRLYDVSSGAIHIDGRDIRSMPLQMLRSHIAYVSQDSFLMSGSIRENICFGLQSVSEDALADAVRQAHVEEFSSKLPLGLDTPVGDNGTLLSGGQRQRISIARAFLKNAPIILLDEATSALDPESEVYINDALTRLSQNRTTLIITHRLQSIRQVDQIMVLHEGRLAEQGRHEELMAIPNGIYAGLADENRMTR